MVLKQSSDKPSQQQLTWTQLKFSSPLKRAVAPWIPDQISRNLHVHEEVLVFEEGGEGSKPYPVLSKNFIVNWD